jgi:DNA-binding NtrC family response regulator
MARIAVVNNYPDFLELMTSILDELVGHEVIGFDSSEATLDDLVEARPDLLIVDLHTVDGVLRWSDAMLSDRPATAIALIPRIVCSADIPAMRARADEFGAHGNTYALEKPFSVDMLVGVVERALREAVLEPVA